MATPNCKIGIRFDRVKEFSSVVESFTEVRKLWFEVKTREDSFFIAQNWVSEHGWLKKGDRIEGVLDVGDPQQIKAWYVRRAVEPSEAEVQI